MKTMKSKKNTKKLTKQNKKKQITRKSKKNYKYTKKYVGGAKNKKNKELKSSIPVLLSSTKINHFNTTSIPNTNMDILHNFNSLSDNEIKKLDPKILVKILVKFLDSLSPAELKEYLLNIHPKLLELLPQGKYANLYLSFQQELNNNYMKSLKRTEEEIKEIKEEIKTYVGNIFEHDQKDEEDHQDRKNYLESLGINPNFRLNIKEYLNELQNLRLILQYLQYRSQYLYNIDNIEDRILMLSNFIGNLELKTYIDLDLQIKYKILLLLEILSIIKIELYIQINKINILKINNNKTNMVQEIISNLSYEGSDDFLKKLISELIPLLKIYNPQKYGEPPAQQITPKPKKKLPPLVNRNSKSAFLAYNEAPNVAYNEEYNEEYNSAYNTVNREKNQGYESSSSNSENNFLTTSAPRPNNENARLAGLTGSSETNNNSSRNNPTEVSFV